MDLVFSICLAMPVCPRQKHIGTASPRPPIPAKTALNLVLGDQVAFPLRPQVPLALDFVTRKCQSSITISAVWVWPSSRRRESAAPEGLEKPTSVLYATTVRSVGTNMRKLNEIKAVLGVHRKYLYRLKDMSASEPRRQQ